MVEKKTKGWKSFFLWFELQMLFSILSSAFGVWILLNSQMFKPVSSFVIYAGWMVIVCSAAAMFVTIQQLKKEVE